MHQINLKNFCRVCGKQEDRKNLTAKERYSDLMARYLSLDICCDDPLVHPPCVCDGCRVKLTRCKAKSSKLKKMPSNCTPVSLDITIHCFATHNDHCAVCSGGTDFKRLATIGQEAGFVATITSDFLTLTKLSKDGKRIVCYGVVHRDMSCELVVGCRDVSKHHLQCEKTVNVMMDLLLTQTVCKGNDEFNDVLQARKGNDVHVVFRDHKGGEVAREDGLTIRHVNCLGFVDGSGERCSVCEQYSNSLRKHRSRHGQNIVSAPSIYTRNDRLSGVQIRQKCASLTEEKKVLKKRVRTLETRMSELIEAEGESIPEDLSNDLLCLGAGHHFEEGSLQHAFWKEQEECLKKSKFAHKWHPSMLRFCIGLHAKSAGAYELLRRSGIVRLPCSRTLRDYSHFTKPVPGFNPDVMARIASDVNVKMLDDYKKNVIITFDEIHIRQGLVYSAETRELIGWVDTGDLNNEISQMLHEDQRMPMAKQIMSIMVRGLFHSMDHVIAYFPCMGFTGEELFFDIWKAVLFVEQVGFKVRALTCDGAASNRKFFKLSSMGNIHYAPHPNRAKNIPIYFICDVPHLLKTTRNNWENSGYNSKSKDLMYNGKPISWTQLISLFEENQQIPSEGMHSGVPLGVLNQIPKITPQHLYLTPSLRMKVKLATQVLSRSVQIAFSLSPTLKDVTESTQIFVGMMDKFFDCMNVRRLEQQHETRKAELAAYTNENDWRFTWLEHDFLQFLNDWEEQCLAKTHINKKDRMRQCLSKETLEGLRITARSFIALGKTLLCEEGVKFLLSAKLNQDPLEQYFSKQRSLGGAAENPDVRSFAYNHLKMVVAGAAAVKASTRGNTTPEDVSSTLSEPMTKRKK